MQPLISKGNESAFNKALLTFEEQEKYLSLLNILKRHEEFILNKDGIIVSSNLDAVNITGYEKEQVIGKHISMFYPEEEKSKATADLEKSVRLGRVVVTGLKLKKRSISFWAKMKIQPIKLESDQVTGYKVILKDGTYRALSNMRVRTIKDQYLSIFNNPFVGTFKFRMSDHKLLMWNPKTSQLTGRDDFSRSSFRDFFHIPIEADYFFELLNENEKIGEFEFRLNTIGFNEPRWCLLSCRHFTSFDFAEGILVDITDQKKQLQELKKVNTELDRFIYHASHDLRSPLTTMMGLTNLIDLDKTGEHTHQYNEMLKERIMHLDTLLHDLVSVAYNSTVNPDLEIIPFDKELQSIIRYEVGQNESVKVDFRLDAKADFYSDAIRIKAILKHLVSNAFKYYNKHEAYSWVNILITVSESAATIEIEDNGIGIDQVQQGRIFEMFFRATNEVQGTGLGLYIVKAMIDKLGGQIHFQSTRGMRSFFRVIIPNQILAVTSKQ
jgi:PAS domain S-box-containing protein